MVRKRGVGAAEEAMGERAKTAKRVNSKWKKEDLATEEFLRDRRSIGNL